MKKVRKHYTAEEKVAILRRRLLDQEPISKLCDEVGLQPTVFYRWQKEFFENGAAAFEQKTRAGGTTWLIYYRSRSNLRCPRWSSPRRTRAPSGHSAGGGVIGWTR